MGRNKKKLKNKEIEQSFVSSLKKETTEGIFAIVFIFISIFLFLSSASKAGVVGDVIYKFLNTLFGFGYFLIPIILLGLGISFLASLSRNFATPKIIAAILLFISGLGFINLVSEKGGLVGGLISKPLVKLFEPWVTFILLFGAVMVSILIIFDMSLKFGFITSFFERMRGDKKNDENGVGELTINTGENKDSVKLDAKGNAKYEEEDVEYEPQVRLPEEMKEGKNGNSGLIFLSKKTTGREFTPPPLSILEKDSGKPGVGDVKANANIIKRTLLNFGINVEMDEVSIGPSVTRYALKPAEGVKLAKIVTLQKDLSLALAAHPLRIEAPIPGKSLVGIEIPNTTKTLVGLGSLLRASEYQDSDKPLLVCLGKGITGQSHFANLAKMPHALIAGSTGSGKSVTIHAVITSLLFRNDPENLKFIMVDPKRVELTLYNGIPHLLTPVITDAKKAIMSLKWAANEMDRRYDILEENKVRDIQSYHDNIIKPAIEKSKKNKDAEVPDSMPYIVIVIDELADIMQAYPRELESAIVRLAQMSRAVGIHLILSTQRPSVNVITGLIKANIPARIALQVASQIDSRTILDQPGAEKLLGAGDMLYLSGEMSQPSRIQSAFISENEVKNLVTWLAKQYEDEVPSTEFSFTSDAHGEEKSDIFSGMNNDDDGDDMYREALNVAMEAGKVSTSYLQRKLGIGYARAARLMDTFEDKGIVGPQQGSKPREVLGSRNSDEDLNLHEEDNG